MPFSFPAAHGLTLGALRAVLAELASAADVVGVEVASIAPGAAARLADVLEPVLRRASRGPPRAPTRRRPGSCRRQ